ncbi:NUDIX domain-containing protein [Candidatus Microgenomates bacterium]|nr:NUDIX domain-containing protein [Candidatus Microgenomates bacterium]
MIKEFSAGGIVFERKANNVYWLVCQHSQHKGWVFPKGFIGDHKEGESEEETALREVEEETGVKGRIIVKLPKPAGYFYVWKGEKRFKTVYYFLMEYAGGDIKNHDFEMMKVEWWPKEKVEKSLTYKSDKTAFQEALKLFDDAECNKS